MMEFATCSICGEQVPLNEGTVVKHVRLTALPDRIGPPCCQGSGKPPRPGTAATLYGSNSPTKERR